MSKQRHIVHAAASVLLASAVSVGTPALASEAGAFIGGVFASKVMNNMQRRTAAEEAQAYSSAPAAQPVQQAAPAPAPAPAAQTPQQKLDQLDKLKATPAEYSRIKMYHGGYFDRFLVDDFRYQGVRCQ